MKKKLKALVAMMSLCAIGAVGSAFATSAWSRQDTDATVQTGNYDQAVYLYWDSGAQTSARLSDIETISVGNTVYRYLTVAPKSTKTVDGKVRVTFTLAESGGGQVTGLTINVYTVNALPVDDAAAATLINGKTPNVSLATGHLSGYVDITIAGTTGHAHESFGYYVITAYYEGGATKLGGTVTISQQFTATTA